MAHPTFFRQALIAISLTQFISVAQGQNMSKLEELAGSVLHCEHIVYTDPTLRNNIYDRDRSDCKAARVALADFARSRLSERDTTRLTASAIAIARNIRYGNMDFVKLPIERKYKELEYCRSLCSDIVRD